MFLGDGIIYVVVNEALFLFSIRVEPDLTIRIGWMDSLDQRWRARRKKILGGDEVRAWSIVRCVGAKEGGDGLVTRE